MLDLKNANEMCVLAKAVNQDEAIKIAFTQLQTEIYNEASNGKFYLITKSLLTLDDQQLKIVTDKLKLLGYDLEFLSDNLDPTFKAYEAPKGNVKQGSGDLITKVEPYSIHEENGEKYRINYSSETQESIKGMYRNICAKALVLYDEMIRPVDEGGLGIAPEQARFILPQGVMTEWVSTGSLYAWTRFYNQRTDPHAQKEIQDLAKMVGDIIEPLYPHSWSALTGVKQ